MENDTIFDLSSVTKIFATAPLTAVLVERRWIDWDTRVSAVFPSYPYRDIELRHLLSHTAGFPWWEPFWQKLRERFAPQVLWKTPIRARQNAMRELIFDVTPAVRPGERVEYSDVSFLLLGFVLEEVLQMPLDRGVKELVWSPMGIRGASYRHTTHDPAKADERCAATEHSPWHDTVLQGQVHDENCWAMGGYGGHSGAFGRAEDLLIFSRSMFHRFLSDETVMPMWTRVAQPPGCVRTLGWDTPSGETSSVGSHFSRRSVGHLGFTGTSLWLDPEARLAVALLSNRVHTTRENIKIRALRPKLHEAIRMDLLD